MAAAWDDDIASQGIDPDKVAAQYGRYCRPLRPPTAAEGTAACAGASASCCRSPCCPAWSYSNTNYVVAGLLIERVTGTSVARQLERRFIRPLGLRHTWFPTDTAAARARPGTATEIRFR
jgi:CubicO group peptidase (beta-lactamase class C family)